MSREMPIAALLLLSGASSATAQSLPLFLSAPALPVPGCGYPHPSSISGSATCVRVGGSVWEGVTFGHLMRPAMPPLLAADRIVAPGKTKLSPTRLQARWSFDTRTDTPFGPVRAYVSIRAR